MPPISSAPVARPRARHTVLAHLSRHVLLACAALAVATTAAAQNEVLKPPATADGKPLEVVVGMQLEQVDELDETAQRASVAGWIELRWQDRRSAFDGAAAGVDFREWAGDPAKEMLGTAVWWPDPWLTEVEEDGEMDHFYVRIDTAGRTYVVAHFKAKVLTPLDLRRFPYDHQVIRVAMEPYTAAVEALRFRPAREISGVGRRIALAEWAVEGFDVRDEVEDFTDRGEMWDAYSRYVFELRVSRRYGFYHWKVLLPLAMIVASGWMVFWFRDLATQVAVAFTVLLTIVAFHFAVSDDLPRVAYPTFMDALLLSAHLSVFLSMLTVVVGHILERRGKEHVAARVERTARWAFPLGLAVAITAVAIGML